MSDCCADIQSLLGRVANIERQLANIQSLPGRVDNTDQQLKWTQAVIWGIVGAITGGEAPLLGALVGGGAGLISDNLDLLQPRPQEVISYGPRISTPELFVNLYEDLKTAYDAIPIEDRPEELSEQVEPILFLMSTLASPSYASEGFESLPEESRTLFMKGLSSLPTLEPYNISPDVAYFELRHELWNTQHQLDGLLIFDSFIRDTEGVVRNTLLNLSDVDRQAFISSTEFLSAREISDMKWYLSHRLNPVLEQIPSEYWGTIIVDPTLRALLIESVQSELDRQSYTQHLDTLDPNSSDPTVIQARHFYEDSLQGLEYESDEFYRTVLSSPDLIPELAASPMLTVVMSEIFTAEKIQGVLANQLFTATDEGENVLFDQAVETAVNRALGRESDQGETLQDAINAAIEAKLAQLGFIQPSHVDDIGFIDPDTRQPIDPNTGQPITAQGREAISLAAAQRAETSADNSAASATAAAASLIGVILAAGRAEIAASRAETAANRAETAANNKETADGNRTADSPAITRLPENPYGPSLT